MVSVVVPVVLTSVEIVSELMLEEPLLSAEEVLVWVLARRPAGVVGVVWVDWLALAWVFLCWVSWSRSRLEK